MVNSRMERIKSDAKTKINSVRSWRKYPELTNTKYDDSMKDQNYFQRKDNNVYQQNAK